MDAVVERVVAMDARKPRSSMWSDISDEFELVEERLVYVDAPLEGILRAKTGELFAFRCSAIVIGHLWHWVLLPVQSVEASIEKTFAEAQTAPPSEWVSIVEDRRGETPQLSVVWLKGSVHQIPAAVFH